MGTCVCPGLSLGMVCAFKTDVRSCRAYDYECNRSGIINRDFRRCITGWRTKSEKSVSGFPVESFIGFVQFYFFVGGVRAAPGAMAGFIL